MKGESPMIRKTKSARWLALALVGALAPFTAITCVLLPPVVTICSF